MSQPFTFLITESIKCFCSKYCTDIPLFIAYIPSTSSQFLPLITETNQQRTRLGPPQLFNDNDDDNELYWCHSGSHGVFCLTTRSSLVVWKEFIHKFYSQSKTCTCKMDVFGYWRWIFLDYSPDLFKCISLPSGKSLFEQKPAMACQNKFLSCNLNLTSRRSLKFKKLQNDSTPNT